MFYRGAEVLGVRVQGCSGVRVSGKVDYVSHGGLELKLQGFMAKGLPVNCGSEFYPLELSLSSTGFLYRDLVNIIFTIDPHYGNE